MVTVLRVAGALVIAAGVFTAIHTLDLGFSDAFWFALSELVLAVSLGALILLLAERLAGRDFAVIAQYIQIVAGALIVAIVILALKSMTKDNASILFDPLRHLVSFTPIGLPILLWLSMQPQPDRALGRPDQNGMYAAGAIILISVIVALKDMSDANYYELWVLLTSLTVPVAIGLILLGFTLAGPMPSSVNIAESKLRDWIFFGGVAVWVLGLLIAIHALDAASQNGFWFFIRIIGSYAGVGAVVILASRTQHAFYATLQPFMQQIALASIVLAFVGGLFIALDASSDTFWLFWTSAIIPISFGAMALGVYEVTQRLGEARMRPTPVPNARAATVE